MSANAYVLSPDTYPKPLSVVGVDVTVLASADVTHGYEVTLQEGNAGSGPPLHSHPWDECFFILAGEVEFSYLDRTADTVKVVQAGPGTMFHLPASTPHGFHIKKDGSRMLEMTGKGSLSTRMFAGVDREVAHRAPQAEDIPVLLDVLARHEVKVEA